jgi:hypothetical protein
MSGSGPGTRSAIPAGDLKIPDPIADPTTTAIALHKPSRRGRLEGGDVMGCRLSEKTERAKVRRAQPMASVDRCALCTG